MKSNLFPRRTKGYLFEVKEDLELKSASYSKKEKVQLFPLKQTEEILFSLGQFLSLPFKQTRTAPHEQTT